MDPEGETIAVYGPEGARSTSTYSVDLNKASVDGVLKAIDLFEEATGMDPSWAVAYAALADAYEQLPIQDDGYSKEVYQRRRCLH